MSFADLVFFLIIVITLAGGLTAVLAGSIVHSLIGLIAAMLGIAGLYVYLHSPFLAMMQILIYVGAVSVLIAFAIMLIGPQYRKPREWTTWRAFGLAAIVSALSLGMLAAFVMDVFPDGQAGGFTLRTEDIGRLLFTALVLPFELISLLIVVAILAAVMLALFSKGTR